MTNIKLSKRLSLIASMVDKNAIVADIGCDHALLDIFLIQNKVIKKSIACDITEGAINQAKKNVFINNIKGIETRLADGLDAINEKDKIDTIVISGLGNQKIFEILSNNKSKLKSVNNIIIQSNTNVSKVRSDVVSLGYKIDKEALVKENGIIYVVIKFIKEKTNYNKKELFFGPKLIKNKNDLFYEFYSGQINKNKKVIHSLPISKIGKKIKLILINKMINKELKNKRV